MNRDIGISGAIGANMASKQRESNEVEQNDSVARSEVLGLVREEKERQSARRGFLRKAATGVATTIGVAGVFSGVASACKSASPVCIDGSCRTVNCCVRQGTCYTSPANGCRDGEGNFGCDPGQGDSCCEQFCFEEAC